MAVDTNKKQANMVFGVSHVNQQTNKHQNSILDLVSAFDGGGRERFVRKTCHRFVSTKLLNREYMIWQISI